LRAAANRPRGAESIQAAQRGQLAEIRSIDQFERFMPMPKIRRQPNNRW